MTYTFKPGVRENIGLLIGIAGGTGSGKSYSAALMAKGMAGEKPFAVLDTEARRFLHYADSFRFDHCEIRPPFRPKVFEDAILDADKSGYPVIIVDSTSMIWSGDGGVLDWQEEELDEMVKRAKTRNDSRSEWQIRESGKMAAWIRPKIAHKHMVQRLLQVRAHVILCFRAEEKIEMKKGKDGKIEIVPKETVSGFRGWIPVCEKNLPFELTASFLLTADAPGVPKPIKLQEQHRAMFDLSKPITEDCGKRIAEWAHGGIKRPVSVAAPPPDMPDVPEVTHAEPETPTTPTTLSIEQFRNQLKACQSQADINTVKIGGNNLPEADKEAGRKAVLLRVSELRAPRA